VPYMFSISSSSQSMFLSAVTVRTVDACTLTQRFIPVLRTYRITRHVSTC